MKPTLTGTLITLLLALSGCATTPAGLASKQWNLHTINDELLFGDSKITLKFDNDHQLSGNAGCNDYHADYHLDITSSTTGAIDVQPISTTKRQCDASIMEQEKRYLDALNDAAIYWDKCGRLKIRGQEGEILWFDKVK